MRGRRSIAIIATAGLAAALVFPAAGVRSAGPPADGDLAHAIAYRTSVGFRADPEFVANAEQDAAG